MEKSTPKHSIPDPEVWVEEYGDSLYRFALSRIKDPAVAEELVQETFLAALRSRENFKGRSSGKTWMIAILKHKIIDHLRKKNPEESIEDIERFPDTTDDLFNDRGGWQVHPDEWRTTPGKMYEQKEFLDVFYQCLSGLPERLANTFMLREMDGLSTEEICKMLDISATNCWVILYRARMQLRRCLEINWTEATG